MAKQIIYLLIFTLLVYLTGGNKASATHIVGGDLTYEYLGGNNYRISLNVYVDCINGSTQAIDADVNSKIGVFNSFGTLLQSLSVTRQGPTRIEGKNYSCVQPPANACVDLYIYQSTVSLPDISGGYILMWQRCCRNNTIKNIIRPESTGSTYRTTIPQRSGTGTNSSAKFIGTPPNFLCLDEPLLYNHAAVDSDGDSLVYEVFAPLIGADNSNPAPLPIDFTTPLDVLWNTGYSKDNQMNTSPPMSIDAITGLFQLTPKLTGQFVVGIAVHEYRNQVRINTVFRDFQFNVSQCVFDVKSDFAPKRDYCSDTVSFINNSSGNAFRFRWDFGIAGETKDTSNVKNPSFIFPGPGKYIIQLSAYTSEGCENKSNKSIYILEDKVDSLVQDSIVCYGEQVQLGHIIPETGISYKWSPPDGLDNAFIANPVATVTADKVYRVQKNSISCFVESDVKVFKNTIDAVIMHEYLPPCDGLKVKFLAKGTNFSKVLWDFGDPSTTNDISVDTNTSWFYTDSGIVYVKLWVENKFCKDSVTKPVRIIFPKVFTAVIDTAICFGDKIKIGPLNDTSILSFNWSTSEYMSSEFELYPHVAPEVNFAYVLTKTYAYCKQKDSFNVYVSELPDLSITRSFPGNICPGDSILLEATGPYSFEWFPTKNLSDPFSERTWASPDTAGWYFLKATTIAKCSVVDSVYLDLYPLWELDLPPYYILCKDEVFLPEIHIPDARIIWRDIRTEAQYDSIRQEGTYIVHAKTQCQDLLDTFQMSYYDESYCRLDFPNAFTPNGDGINDTYPYAGNYDDIFGLECSFDSYQLIIFSRWGEVVFRTDDPKAVWDGAFKNDGGIQEVFGYYITYREFDWCRGGYVIHSKRGNITVIH